MIKSRDEVIMDLKNVSQIKIVESYQGNLSDLDSKIKHIDSIVKEFKFQINFHENIIMQESIFDWTRIKL